MTNHVIISQGVRTWRWLSLAVAFLAALACAWGLFGLADRHHFFRAYLFAWMTCLSFSLGGLCLIMLHNLTGGDWGRSLRGVWLVAARTMPAVALLFVPLLFGMRDLYVWATPENVAANPILQHRQPYLNPDFFVFRAAAYFVIWTTLTWLLMSWHAQWTQTGSPRILTRIRGLSAFGLILYLLTMTHAGIDWLMSRDVDFYSTAFGFVVTVGQTLSAAAFSIIILALLPVKEQRRSVLAAAAGRGIRNDIGNILLTLVILWTYVSFMEFLVIWMGNSREDNTWFLQRGLGQPGPWRWFGLTLILFNFFIPFFLLLFRATKQYIPALVGIAWILLLSHILQEYWLVAPSGDHSGPQFDVHWLDVAALVAVGGLWLSCFLWMLPRQWPVPSPAGELGSSSNGAVVHGS